MDANRLGWQDPLAGMVMSGTDQPELKGELESAFCKADPVISRQFAETTFLGDNRDDLARVTAPTLILQSRADVIAPMSAGEFVRDHIRGSQFVVVDTAGHCPHLSAPTSTIEAMEQFLTSLSDLRSARS